MGLRENKVQSKQQQTRFLYFELTLSSSRSQKSFHTHFTLAQLTRTTIVNYTDCE